MKIVNGNKKRFANNWYNSLLHLSKKNNVTSQFAI